MKNNETKKRIVHHKLEVGKALSLEPTIMLDVYDHEMDLQDRYEDEQLNPLFDTKVVNYKANNSMGSMKVFRRSKKLEFLHFLLMKMISIFNVKYLILLGRYIF